MLEACSHSASFYHWASSWDAKIWLWIQSDKHNGRRKAAWGGGGVREGVWQGLLNCVESAPGGGLPPSASALPFPGDRTTHLPLDLAQTSHPWASHIHGQLLTGQFYLMSCHPPSHLACWASNNYKLTTRFPVPLPPFLPLFSILGKSVSTPQGCWVGLLSSLFCLPHCLWLSSGPHYCSTPLPQYPPLPWPPPYPFQTSSSPWFPYSSALARVTLDQHNQYHLGACKKCRLPLSEDPIQRQKAPLIKVKKF